MKTYLKGRIHLNINIINFNISSMSVAERFSPGPLWFALIVCDVSAMLDEISVFLMKTQQKRNDHVGYM